MAKRAARLERFRDRAEEILDDLYSDRNAELRNACKTIIKSASHGLAICEDIAGRDAAARASNTQGVPHVEFLNVQGFLWEFELELACLLDDYIRSRGERRWLYARLLFLSLFESTKTLRRIFSIAYRREVEAVLGEESRNELNEIHRYIQSIFEDLNKTYGDVRNGLAAHRDPDARVRFKLLSTLSPLDIKDLAWELLAWCASVETIQKRYLATLNRDNP
jgi:hypothetical protein